MTRQIAARIPRPKRGRPDEEHRVPDANDVAFATRVPAQPVVDRKGHQEDRRQGCQNEADEENDPTRVADLAEMGGEWHGEQKGEQYLGAGEHDPQFAQELHQLPVRLRLLGLAVPAGAQFGRRRPGATSGGREAGHFLLFFVFVFLFFVVRPSTRLALATIFS